MAGHASSEWENEIFSTYTVTLFYKIFFKYQICNNERGVTKGKGTLRFIPGLSNLVIPLLDRNICYIHVLSPSYPGL